MRARSLLEKEVQNKSFKNSYFLSCVFVCVCIGGRCCTRESDTYRGQNRPSESPEVVNSLHQWRELKTGPL